MNPPACGAVASFLAWTPFTLGALATSFTFLAMIGVPLLAVGTYALIASVGMARGSRCSTVLVLVLALVLVALHVLPWWLAHGGPDGGVWNVVWFADVLLATLAAAAACGELRRTRRPRHRLSFDT